MKTFFNECSFKCKYFSIAFLVISPFFFLVIYTSINAEKNCIEYAKFIELDYKFDSNHGCYVKRNNIWISKSESKFR